MEEEKGRKPRPFTNDAPTPSLPHFQESTPCLCVFPGGLPAGTFPCLIMQIPPAQPPRPYVNVSLHILPHLST